uniref:Uncharacterized protein n=1 Tax=Zea mays TaxID=4577 RepID=B6UDN0_MAIZE|nr:hypothetical protein [Zea mays]
MSRRERIEPLRPRLAFTIAQPLDRWGIGRDHQVVQIVRVVSRARKLAGETNCLPVLGRILTGNPRAALQRRPAASTSSRVQ